MSAVDTPAIATIRRFGKTRRIVSLHDVEEGFLALESGGAMKVLVDCRPVAGAMS